MDQPAKYSKDAPFEDPVVRCDSCQTLLWVKELRELGRCHFCGSHKVKNVFSFNEKELAWMREKGVDEVFIALFEGKEGEVTHDKRH